jgi:hypothetical protein
VHTFVVEVSPLSDAPVIWPWSLRLNARLVSPPRVPKSVMMYAGGWAMAMVADVRTRTHRTSQTGFSQAKAFFIFVVFMFRFTPYNGRSVEK